MIEYFSKHDRDTIVTKKEIATIFKKSPLSITRAVKRGELPPPVRLLNSDAWTIGAILDFLNEKLNGNRVIQMNERKRLWQV